MLMRSKIIPTVDGRNLDEIKLGNRTGECTRILFDDPSTGDRHAFFVDDAGENLVHFSISNTNIFKQSTPGVYPLNYDCSYVQMTTVDDAIAQIVPELKDQIWYFEFDIND